MMRGRLACAADIGPELCGETECVRIDRQIVNMLQSYERVQLQNTFDSLNSNEFPSKFVIGNLRDEDFGSGRYQTQQPFCACDRFIGLARLR